MNSYKQVYKYYELWHNSNGLAHRKDGPAYSANDTPGYPNDNGYIGWYVDGKRYYNNKLFQEAANLSDEDMLAMIMKYGNVR
jgi:hypothetical protein